MWLVEFEAEYYCQGYEWAHFTRLVNAKTFEEACQKIVSLSTSDWVYQSPKNFKNCTI